LYARELGLRTIPKPGDPETYKGEDMTIKEDLTADEAQFIALLRTATTDAQQDGAQLIADAKAAGAPLWNALQQLLNGGNTPAPPVPVTPVPASVQEKVAGKATKK
jgi:hypothetical protein